MEVKPRLPQAVVLHRETYQLEKQNQEIEMYKQSFYQRGLRAMKLIQQAL